MGWKHSSELLHWITVSNERGICVPCASLASVLGPAAPSPIDRVLARFKDAETAMSGVRNLNELDFNGRPHFAGVAIVAEEASF